MPISVEVSGDYACFTRPEMKVERVSYDVMTPSAARGILEAIFWHPGMRYVITKIHVCNPISFTNIRRNEIKDVISSKTAKELMKKHQGEPYIAACNSIQQRAAMVLKDVRYVIEARFVMTEKANASDNPGKFLDMFNRRVEKGQCYHQPCLGVREFPAKFERSNEIYTCPPELVGEKDLGWMLYDMDFTDLEDIKPMFFRAKLVDGVITVPSVDSKEVVK